MKHKLCNFQDIRHQNFGIYLQQKRGLFFILLLPCVLLLFLIRWIIEFLLLPFCNFFFYRCCCCCCTYCKNLQIEFVDNFSLSFSYRCWMKLSFVSSCYIFILTKVQKKNSAIRKRVKE